MRTIRVFELFPWTADAPLAEIDYESAERLDPRLAQLFVTLSPELLAEVGLREPVRFPQ